jgi:hypothetical protein
MPRSTSIPAPLAAALFLVIAGAGCDPQAPGASGTMTLGAGVDVSGFPILVLRTFANASGPYDSSAPIPADAYRDYEATASITFPYHYTVGGGVGVSDVGDWQMVAWLSHRTRAELTQATNSDPGDPVCSVAYRVRGCNGMGGYCGVTSGVDCVLAPPPSP